MAVVFLYFLFHDYIGLSLSSILKNFLYPLDGVIVIEDGKIALCGLLNVITGGVNIVGMYVEATMDTYIYRKSLYKKQGNVVEYFDNAAKYLRIIFFKFSDEDVKKSVLEHIKN